MKLKTFAAALFALFLAACNPMEQLDGAEEFITQYHSVYNDGDSRTLYGLTSEEFRGATSIEQMDGMVAFVTERMGPVVSTEREGFNLNTDNGLTETTITMKTQFEKGEGTETFVFHGSGDDFRLVSWNVNSPNLINEPAAPAEPVAAE